MNRELDNNGRVLVGLMVIFALLIFLSRTAWEERESSEFWTKYIDKSLDQQVAKVEEEKEPETVLDSNKPMIALTFDDGPSKYTGEILDTLELYDVKATFFVLGSRVEQYPETMKKMNEIGCEIASHTYHHHDLTKLPPEGVISEISSTNVAVKNVLGYETYLVRPPYGATTEEVRANIGYPLVMWSVDTTDWQSKDAASVVNHVLSVAKDGDVVLMHDIYESTVEAVKMMIPILQERGYQIVTVSEMAKARGATLEHGQNYYHFYKE